MAVSVGRIKFNAVILLLVLCSGVAHGTVFSAGYLVNSCGNCTCIGNQSSADCSNKNLRSVPKNLPTNIEELNLSFNKIDFGEINRSICTQYPELKKISLEGNEATRLSNNIFQGCDRLRELNLKGNVLDTIAPETTQDLKHLKSLSSLEVVEVQDGALGNLQELEILDLTWHGIAIWPGVFQGLQTLKELSLSLHKAILLPEQLFGFGHTNDLTKLKLKGSKVKAFPANLLSGLNKLKYLHLDLPSLFKLKLNKDKKPKDLQTLEIYNVISIPEDTLFGFESLERVKLHGIQKIPKASLFQHANFLKELEVAACAMTSIPQGWFNNMTSLEMLNLSENGLETLDPGDFAELKSLKDLVLSRNKIRELPGAILSPVHRTLQQLLVNHNQLELLASGTVLQMNKLQVIDLSHNIIRHVAATAFSHLPWLRQLQLEGNYIETLDGKTFSSTPKLQVLNLAENVITIFPESIIQTGITHLTLSSNRLRFLPGEKLCQAKNLKMLNVADNPIFCDCEARKLSYCLPDLKIDGECSGPVEVDGWPLMYLTACPIPTNRATTSSITTTTKTTLTTTTTTSSTTTQQTTTTTPATTATTTTPTTFSTPSTTTTTNSLASATTTTTTLQTIKPTTSTASDIPVAITTSTSATTKPSTTASSSTPSTAPSTSKTNTSTTSSILAVVDIVLPPKSQDMAASAAGSGKETDVDSQDEFGINFDAYPEILRPLVDTDISIKKPPSSGALTGNEKIEPPSLSQTSNTSQNANASTENLTSGSLQPGIGNTSISLPWNVSESEFDSQNSTSTSKPLEMNSTMKKISVESLQAFQEVDVNSEDEKKVQPMHAKVNKDTLEENGGYLSQAGNITLAIFVSLALMVGVLTGIWLYKKNGQSGSYSSYQDADHFLQMQTRSQQTHPPNQKRSNTTRENRD